jgi:hypothetical protein
MADVKWSIKAREFVNCNCSYGCPCQFNGRPSYGNCEAVTAMQIDEGIHGNTRLDGLRFVGIFRWPGAIHEGKGEAAVVIDERASEPQRNALLRILTGQDTEPGATIFQVFSTTFEKLHEPIFSAIGWLCAESRKDGASRSKIRSPAMNTASASISRTVSNTRSLKSDGAGTPYQDPCNSRLPILTGNSLT